MDDAGNNLFKRYKSCFKFSPALFHPIQNLLLMPPLPRPSVRTSSSSKSAAIPREVRGGLWLHGRLPQPSPLSLLESCSFAECSSERRSLARRILPEGLHGRLLRTELHLLGRRREWEFLSSPPFPCRVIHSDVQQKYPERGNCWRAATQPHGRCFSPRAGLEHRCLCIAMRKRNPLPW